MFTLVFGRDISQPPRKVPNAGAYQAIIDFLDTYQGNELADIARYFSVDLRAIVAQVVRQVYGV